MAIQACVCIGMDTQLPNVPACGINASKHASVAAPYLSAILAEGALFLSDGRWVALLPFIWRRATQRRCHVQ
jgi:hypothetical protein